MFKFKKALKNKKGFTLIELIVVIAILGILAALVAPRLMGFQESAREKADQQMAATIANASVIHITEQTSFAGISNADTFLAAVATANLIDASLNSVANVNTAITSQKYAGGFRISYDTTTHALTVTLAEAGTGTDDFVIIK